MKIYPQPFHLVTLRPWPILVSFNLLSTIIRLVNWFHNINFYYVIFNNIILFICIYQWWRDVIRESSYQGFHTNLVLEGLKLGIILFIISELFFFIRFFWCYLHIFLSPNIEIGNYWPPFGIFTFNPYNIPLLNTLILLRSGVSITLRHYYLIKNNIKLNYLYLLITVILGVIFTLFQLIEYMEAKFRIRDRIYGSIFFIGTGFHGLHVLIGSIYLIINLLRIYNKEFSKLHHFRFEAASWYWHFVDVIWLFLFILIYYWSS